MLLREVEQEVTRQMQADQVAQDVPILRARMSNLVVFCDRLELAEQIAAQIPEIVSVHPCRVLLMISDGNADEVTASVTVWCRRGRDKRSKICSEQVMLRAGSRAVDRLPFAMRELLIGDLPTNLWWAVPQPPPLAGALLFDLAENAQQILYDSVGWAEPARGVAAAAAWLGRIERGRGEGPWRVVADLNWRRLKHWRRLLAQVLAPASAPGALESIREVLVEHGPHGVVQAWELISWMASGLGWAVQGGRVQPNVEISWQAAAPHGRLAIRLRRLSAGPPEVRRVRVACNLDGKSGAFNLTVEDDRRLAVQPEGIAAAPRTLTIQPMTLSDLVARQLSDRERDPVFRDSMEVAQLLAQSVLV